MYTTHPGVSAWVVLATLLQIMTGFHDFGVAKNGFNGVLFLLDPGHRFDVGVDVSFGRLNGERWPSRLVPVSPSAAQARSTICSAEHR